MQERFRIPTLHQIDQSLQILLQGRVGLGRSFAASATAMNATLCKSLRSPLSRGVGAMLAGSGDELDIKAAPVAMQKQNAREIVTVNDNDTHVRVSIDWLERELIHDEAR